MAWLSVPRLEDLGVITQRFLRSSCHLIRNRETGLEPASPTSTLQDPALLSSVMWSLVPGEAEKQELWTTCRAETLAITELGAAGEKEEEEAKHETTGTDGQTHKTQDRCYSLFSHTSCYPTPFLREAEAEVRIRCLGIKEEQPVEEKDIR